jgi:uncharacterized protein
MTTGIAKCLCLGLLALGFMSFKARAGEAALKDSVPHVTVMGSADLDVAPNIAIITLGIATERPEAANAINENARTGQAVVENIKTRGIEARDIRTITATLSPVYDTVTDPVGHAESQKLRAYNAHSVLEIRIRQLDKAGALARQLVDNGANEFQQIRFEIEHPEMIYEKLRGEAMQDAWRRAKSYLPPAGLKLGRIIEIIPTELVEGTPPPYRWETNKSFAASSSFAIPVEPGTQNLHTSVRVTWELVQ